MTTKPYQVGYKRPPISSRFKPGQSGNPKGRTKGERSFGTLLDIELNKKIVTVENGRRRTVAKREALASVVVARALKTGDSRTLAVLLANSVGLRATVADEIEFNEENDKAIVARYLKSLDGKGELP